MFSVQDVTVLKLNESKRCYVVSNRLLKVSNIMD